MRCIATVTDASRHTIQSGVGHFEQLTNLFLDGATRDDDDAELFSHLSRCASCRCRLNALVEFRRRVQAERFEIPPKTDAELFSRVGSRSSRPGLTRRNTWEQKRLGSMQSRATIGSLAGVVALLLIVVTMFSSEQISVDDTAGQEVVRFETATPSVAPVYVFYPGLVIEESR